MADKAKVMDLKRQYAFNLPWRGVVICTGFYFGLAFIMAHDAKKFAGVISACLVALSAVFTVLACTMMMRRLIFPRVLELSEDAILFPRGFPTTRIVRIHYADIVWIWELKRGNLGMRFSCRPGRNRL